MTINFNQKKGQEKNISNHLDVFQMIRKVPQAGELGGELPPISDPPNSNETHPNHLSNQEHRYRIGRVYELILQVAQNTENAEENISVSEKNSIFDKEKNSTSAG